MSNTTGREALVERRQKLLSELEQLEDVSDDDDTLPETRLADIRRELQEIELQLSPEASHQRRHDGRSDADSL